MLPELFLSRLVFGLTVLNLLPEVGTESVQGDCSLCPCCVLFFMIPLE